MMVATKRSPGADTTETTNAASYALRYEGVGRRFRRRGDPPFVALQDVHLEVGIGEFVCLLGPSGCGKSTMLELAAGLLRPTRGIVRYEGQQVDGINTSVGYVTQKDSLLPWRTVRRNVGLPLEVQGWSRRDRNRRVDEVLEKVGLTGFSSLYPSQLSGGMLKRASIAQTMSYGPDTLLMDEPFGALDAQLRQTLQQELIRIWESERCTVVFVTHDIDEALLLGQRIVVFGAAPGRILHVEEVTIPRPRNARSLATDPNAQTLRDKIWRLLAHEQHGAE